MQSISILFAAGLLAGALNAAVGGGSFVSILATVFAGLPPVAANASSTVALLAGTLASAWAWPHDFRAFEGIPLCTLLLISLGSGLVGAILLLVTPQRAFDGLLPWLLLLGTLAFTFGHRAGDALRSRVRIGAPASSSARMSSCPPTRAISAAVSGS
jgi:uncharacterized membrane protein YfcA